MKISYFSNSILPSRAANSIHVMKMCSAMSKSGNEVTLYAPNNQILEEPGIYDIFDFYGVEKTFNIKKKLWPKLKGRAYIYSYLAVRDSVKNNVEIAYSRNLIAAYFSVKNNVPTIFEIHQPITSYDHISSILFNKLIKEKHFKKLIVITQALKNYFLKWHPQLIGKIIVAPDAADPVPQNIEPIQLRRGNRLIAGYVGQLYSGKGMEIICKLCHLLPSVDFHVVGGFENDIEKWKIETKSAANIFYHGFQPHSKISSYISEFDLVLLPNQRRVSTFGGGTDIGEWTSPLKMFEYMAAGKPIISSDLPVLQEILNHNINAKLCSPERINDWVLAINELNGEEERSRIGEKARLDFNENHTWRARANKVLHHI